MFSNEFIKECIEALEKLNPNDIEKVVDVLAEIREKKDAFLLLVQVVVQVMLLMRYAISENCAILKHMHHTIMFRNLLHG